MSSLFFRIPLQDKILFAKNLALALKAGVPLVSSLRLMKNQTRNRSFQRVIDSVIEDTNKGAFLSTGLMKFKNIFGELFINIILSLIHI